MHPLETMAAMAAKKTRILVYLNIGHLTTKQTSGIFQFNAPGFTRHG
jgi:hypothetical protein